MPEMDLAGTVIVATALLGCGVCAVLMSRSRRPDGKMAFLLGLIDGTQQKDDEANSAKTAEPAPVGPRGRNAPFR